MCGIQKRTAWRLVYTARLESHDPVLDQVHAAHGVPSPDRVQFFEQLQRGKADSVHGHGSSRLELDFYPLALSRGFRRIDSQQKHLRLRRVCRVLERSAFV